MGYEDFFDSEAVRVAVAAVGLILAFLARRIIKGTDAARAAMPSDDTPAEAKVMARLDELQAQMETLSLQVRGIESQAQQRGESLVRNFQRHLDQQFADLADQFSDHSKRVERISREHTVLMNDILKEL